MSTRFDGDNGAVMPAEAQSDRAPGTLDLIRRFVNSVELPDGPDELGALEGARAWCLSYGLPPVTNQAHLELLLAFRETLRDLLFANNGEGDAAAAWRELNPFMTSTRLSLSVDPYHGLELLPAHEEDKGPIASLLAIVYESQVRETWPRLRACRKQSCRFAYYDQTKNGSRAWCSMATCGNQAKAQRRRERARGQGA